VAVIADPAPDLHVSCRDCAQPFVIDPGQQAWYVAKGFPLPVRCESCRATRRLQRA
jgi:hypothetical protein